MRYSYRTKGTCSTQIDVTVEDSKVKHVAFTGGCHGNLQGIARLVEGMKVEDVIQKCEGIRCGYKATSCPDQLAKALKEAQALEQKGKAQQSSRLEPVTDH